MIKQQHLDMLGKWLQISEQLTKLKNEELSLRKILFKEISDDFDLKEGVNNIDLPNNYQLKINKKFNYNVDVDSFKNCISLLIDRGIDPNTLVKWKPSLMLSVYKKLNDNDKYFVDSNFVSFKQSESPSFEIVQKIK